DPPGWNEPPAMEPPSLMWNLSTRCGTTPRDVERLHAMWNISTPCGTTPPDVERLHPVWNHPSRCGTLRSLRGTKRCSNPLEWNDVAPLRSTSASGSWTATTASRCPAEPVRRRAGAPRARAQGRARPARGSAFRGLGRRGSMCSTIETSAAKSELMSILGALGARRLIPVVVLDDARHAEPLAAALVAGGLPVAE